MNRLLAAVAGWMVLAGLAYGAVSELVVATGDRRFDSVLQRMNTEAKADPDGFIQRLSTRFGVAEPDIRQAQQTHGLGAADLYMATALAQATHRLVLTVAEEYKQNPGKGWGVMAKEMGIKPGSREFHDLKRGAQTCLAQERSAGKARQKHERELKKPSRGGGHGKPH